MILSSLYYITFFIERYISKTSSLLVTSTSHLPLQVIRHVNHKPQATLDLINNWLWHSYVTISLATKLNVKPLKKHKQGVGY